MRPFIGGPRASIWTGDQRTETSSLSVLCDRIAIRNAI
jgi:hypothetical protein